MEEAEHSENGDVVVDLGAVPLGDALCDPHDVPALLLLQLDVGVEDAEVELVEEGQLVQLHLEMEAKPVGPNVSCDEPLKVHASCSTSSFT